MKWQVCPGWVRPMLAVSLVLWPGTSAPSSSSQTEGSTLTNADLVGTVGGIQIEHSAVGCVVAEQHPCFEARLHPAGKVREARLRFRPAGGRHWHSVAMEQRGERFTGILPKPKATLSSFDYYIDVIDQDLLSVRTEEYSPSVEAGPLACQGKVAAATMGTALVAVTGPAGVAGAPLVPAGFSGSGVVGAGAGAASAGGIGTTPLLVVGGVVAAGAAVGVAAGGEDAPDPLSVDDDGDGYSESQGDCNDSDPQVRPGGGFSFSVAFSYTGRGNCVRGNPRQQAYTIQNNACEALLVQSLTASQVYGGQCRAAGSFALDLAVSTVAPAGTAAIRLGAAAGTVQAVCCYDAPCAAYGPWSPADLCTISEEYTVVASAGTQTASNSFDHTIDDSCPQCIYEPSCNSCWEFWPGPELENPREDPVAGMPSTSHP